MGSKDKKSSKKDRKRKAESQAGEPAEEAAENDTAIELDQIEGDKDKKKEKKSKKQRKASKQSFVVLSGEKVWLLFVFWNGFICLRFAVIVIVFLR